MLSHLIHLDTSTVTISY